MILLGVIVGISVVLDWIHVNFGEISQISTSVVALSLIVIGIQIISCSIFLSMMLLNNENDLSGCQIRKLPMYMMPYTPIESVHWRWRLLGAFTEKSSIAIRSQCIANLKSARPSLLRPSARKFPITCSIAWIRSPTSRAGEYARQARQVLREIAASAKALAHRQRRNRALSSRTTGRTFPRPAALRGTARQIARPRREARRRTLASHPAAARSPRQRTAFTPMTFPK